jgi:rare lipoprotein A (peptidoglycan hydrolase)
MKTFNKYYRFSAGAIVCIRQMVTGVGLFCPTLFFLAACAQDKGGGFDTVASWYGKPDGKGGYEDCTTLTAYGKRYDSSKLVCASWEFPPGTKLRVSLGRTRSIVVTVVDKGPGLDLRKKGKPNSLKTRRIDLSLGAFKRLAQPAAGVISVHVERL